MISLNIETTDLPAVIQLAAQRGLLMIESGQLVIGDDGMPVPVPDVSVHLAGPRVMTPAVYDEEGNETTPAVMDTTQRLYMRFKDEGRARTLADEFDGFGVRGKKHPEATAWLVDDLGEHEWQ